MRKEYLPIGVISLALVGALGIAGTRLEQRAAAQGQAKVQAPLLEVDPFWPKPLPNRWVLGALSGVWVDKQDHIWILNRADTTATAQLGLDTKDGWCCATAPYVMEFDQAGNLLRHWGGPGNGYDWPAIAHGIAIDSTGNVWVGGGTGGDSQLLKFTADGKFLMQVGKKNVHQAGTAPAPAPRFGGAGRGTVPVFKADSQDMQNFGGPTKIVVDAKTNEAFISDGFVNHRVAVIDADSGAIKRFWGAYGNKPDDAVLATAEARAANDKAGRPPSQQFLDPVHCVAVSNDDLVYVCDRASNRVQVFSKDGKFVKEGFFTKETLAGGSVWDIAFSADPQQKYLYVADGTNQVVYVALRDTLELQTMFGEGGRQVGEFAPLHSIATDSKGNVYTAEGQDTFGNWAGHRLQKFIYKGVGMVSRDQGVLWKVAQ